ncbi:MAG TPA: hypothetical protein VEA17_13560 [Bordetella sp.]|nr:hypothetical protein [Bordetella sp.]
MMKATRTRLAIRCLALAGVAALAACQHTAPKRANGGPAGPATASATQQTPQQTAQQPPQQATGSTAPVVTFHLAQAQPADGLARVQLNPSTSLYAVPNPVFTQADLQQVVPVQGKNGQVFLRFDFTQQGAAKLAKVTREALGNYLIVSVRGKVIGVPRIATAYEDGNFPLPASSVEEAQAMVQLLRQPAN